MARHILCKRLYSGASGVVQLSFEQVTPSTIKSDVPTIIMHGLFGSKQNWRSLSKSIAQKCSAPVLSVDLRNHGDSPHASTHHYSGMAADIRALVHSQGFRKVNLIGHSMGGKLAMHLALNSTNSWINKVVVVDMAPVNQVNPDTTAFQQYIDAMKEVESANVSSPREADEILQNAVPEISVRQFLLTNLKKNHGQYRFRNNIEAIERGLQGLWSFPSLNEPSITPFENPVLFISGGKSNYVRSEMTPLIQSFFPSVEFYTVPDAGHWVHAEKPTEFVTCVSDFLIK